MRGIRNHYDSSTHSNKKICCFYSLNITILPALIALTIKLIPKDTFDKFRKEAEGMWQNGKPKKWSYAIPIVLIWLFVIGMIIKAVIS